MTKSEKATGHIVTPEGKEIASTAAMWLRMPRDWRALATYLPCKGCTSKVGAPVDHPVNRE